MDNGFDLAKRKPKRPTEKEFDLRKFYKMDEMDIVWVRPGGTSTFFPAFFTDKKEADEWASVQEKAGYDQIVQQSFEEYLEENNGIERCAGWLRHSLRVNSFWYQACIVMLLASMLSEDWTIGEQVACGVAAAALIAVMKKLDNAWVDRKMKKLSGKTS